MVKQQLFCWTFAIVFISGLAFAAEKAGSIRGIVYDQDFDAPLANAKVTIAETGQTVTATDEGNFVIGEVTPGTYTVVFAKEGYTRQVKANVVVISEQMTEINASLAGEFAEMEEFVVQDVQIGGGTEVALLDLRMESPALMDSVSSELMSQAGASDAASALRLVSGATVQEGRFAVIRGLPARYVNAQMNGVRLPSADPDKRSVQLDQFPSAIIESIQVTKTFTPDQQGDASGGAVNVVLKGIPDETTFNLSIGTGLNTQVHGSDFLTYSGGGVNCFGDDDRSIPEDGLSFDPAISIREGDEPIDYKFSFSGGGKYWLEDDIKIGGFGSFFYERDSSYFDDGINDSLWVDKDGEPLTPQYKDGAPTASDPQNGDFTTKMWDITQASEEVKWGGLATFGIETENNALSVLYMYTRTTDDTATLAENTRGKLYWFPDYDVDDPLDPGNVYGSSASPYLRTETLKYTERTTETLQFHGDHTLQVAGFDLGTWFKFYEPELDWTIARSSATLLEPDKRQFGSEWAAARAHPVLSTWIYDEGYGPYKASTNINYGNLQRIWKDIEETSDQYQLNLKLPFEQWSGDEGYVKFGLFKDSVDRSYDQESFGNYKTLTEPSIPGVSLPWDESYSEVFDTLGGPITKDGPPFIDVDYKGEQELSAWYTMADLPVNSWLNFIGGARFESTEISIVNSAEQDVTWFPPGASAEVQLNPGDADVAFSQNDVLPSIGFILEPFEPITLRGSYSETVARQTFKELSPIQQMEFLGADVFIGNPELQMSALKNYDLRLDYTPYEGGLFSVSWFYKDVEDAIEYVQRVAAGLTFTTPVNYPEGEINGFEVEVRQKMGYFWEELEGLSLGANATFIDSQVTLPADEAAQFSEPAINKPMTTRDMSNAPEHLYNLYATYDWEPFDAQLAIFYTVKGDTLIAGAGQSNQRFVPSIYEKEYGTLNLSISKKLGDIWKLKFQAKNLLNPKIQTVYRSEYLDGDTVHTSYRKGMEFSLSLSANF